jgi:hypothetical protein
MRIGEEFVNEKEEGAANSAHHAGQNKAGSHGGADGGREGRFGTSREFA